MSGDYSRIRFDPRKDIASVWMQQGRVQLDSDWNEGMAALDRRLRAESVDTFGVHPVPGRTGVAVVSPQTPNAFKIEINGDNITIGQGRMYVDGSLVENHGGSGAAEFDPVLAELRGRDPLAYDEQPYFLEPPLPEGPYLAYLEVWQRELTYLQYPEMVENAVGVDTTTRWQTVWQVRFLALNEGGNVNCNTRNEDLPQKWQELIRPSAGRMSIKAEGVPPGLDPCELPPSGGYRGLENQLYHIEIHDGGTVGKATFKWSRDNASVASPVVEIVSQTAASTELKLASLGRDAVLRFNTGDWVEILDDRRELNGENGDPALRRGVMRQITVDNARQTIQFSPALPADLIPADKGDTLAARHTRVRRWDQKGATVDSDTGSIEVPTADVWVELEKGIKVQFSLAADEGEFRSGDYWVSAARTVDTSIETFTDAPPRGIHRHYARLAIIDFDNDSPVVSDCRTHWPPACGGCCTLTVAPGESIQAAINSLPLAGGCVCLKTGVHIIHEHILIKSSHIILQGESPGVTVRLENSESVSFVLGIGSNDTKVSNIVVQRIRFEGTTELLLAATNCMELQVTHCEFSNVAGTLNNNTIGLGLGTVSNATIASNRIQNVMIGIFLFKCDGHIDIRDNFIEGVVEKDVGIDPISLGYGGIFTDDEGKDYVVCHIENNVIKHFQVGISLNAFAKGSVIIGNRLLYRGPFKSVSESTEFSYVIDVAGADCEVRCNDIDLGIIDLKASDDEKVFGGIRVRASGVKIASNRLRNQNLRSIFVIGILCLMDEYTVDQVTISDNYLLEFQMGIFISWVNNATVSGNFIKGSQYSSVMLEGSNHSCVWDNFLQDSRYALVSIYGKHNHIRGNNIDQAVGGIVLVDETNPVINGNHLYSCGTGIVLNNPADIVTLLNNRLMNCGYLPLNLSEGSNPEDPVKGHSNDSFEVSIYVFSRSSTSAIRIDGCEVIDTSVTANRVFQATRAWGIAIFGSLTALQITNNRIDYTDLNSLTRSEVKTKEHRAFLFRGSQPPSTLLTGNTLINGNHFRGPGQSALVEFQSTSSLSMSFSNNICYHFDSKNPGVTVTLSGLENNRFTVIGNQIASENLNSSLLLNGSGNAIFMGNTMTGSIIYDTSTTTISPSPSTSFNIHS